MDQIKALEGKLYDSERSLQEQAKQAGMWVEKSEYLWNELRQKEIDIAWERGEDLAKLKNRKENLEKERGRILDNL